MSSRSTYPMAHAMRILSGRWRLLLISHLLKGPKRFSELEREASGISQRMLALDLKKLEDAGIVARIVLPEFPVKIEYHLTEEGQALREIVALLDRWAQRLTPSELPPTEGCVG